MEKNEAVRRTKARALAVETINQILKGGQLSKAEKMKRANKLSGWRGAKVLGTFERKTEMTPMQNRLKKSGME